MEVVNTFGRGLLDNGSLPVEKVETPIQGSYLAFL